VATHGSFVLLQRKCFDAPLQLQELEGIKEMVRERAEGGVRDDGLTEAGFLYLHTIFIQRGRLETTWTVLRKFGYGEDLKLTESFLLPGSVHHPRLCIVLTYRSRFDVPHDCSVELSPKGYQFFTDIFETFDKAILHVKLSIKALLIIVCRIKMAR